MRFIVITPEQNMPQETSVLNLLFEEGLELLHIRKPGFDCAEFRTYLSGISPVYYNRLVVHDHFDIAISLGISRIHLNNRHPEVPDHKNICVSRSCHSLEELKEAEKYEYLFLSPVFDSISKQGYTCRFPAQVLAKAAQEGIITHQVIALGGIGKQHIQQVAAWGFGGVAFIGAIWGDYAETGNVSALITRYKELSTICKEV